MIVMIITIVILIEIIIIIMIVIIIMIIISIIKITISGVQGARPVRAWWMSRVRSVSIISIFEFSI